MIIQPRTRRIAAVLLSLALLGCSDDQAPQTGAVDNEETSVARTPGEFEARASYVADGRQIGTRWQHRTNGLNVVTLSIQSVPQVFLHVNTPPVSDRGEPHTGEHLLLGKGRKGRILSAAESKSLIGSTAYTSQSDVVYAWNCSAGNQTFLESVDRYLDALLLPDYTDEEVRREVCNLGVVRDDATGALGLEEKGTIYNEMVSAYEKRWNAWRGLRRRLWGRDHPLGRASGGEPAAVREMEPEHIHAFHRDHYHLSGNLGMIVALPDTLAEATFLEHLSATIARLDTDETLVAREKKTPGIPPAQPEGSRAPQIVPYPNANEEAGGVALFAWPPVPHTTRREHVTTAILLGALGEGQTATLYKRLMDGATREMEIDASELFGWLESSKVDEAAIIGFDGFSKRHADPESLGQIQALLADEIGRVAGLAEGSEDLATFNAIADVKLTEWEKSLRKSLNAPPLFGHRSSGGFWLDHLRLVDREGGDERDLTLTSDFSALRADLAAGRNLWTAAIERMGLLGTPYVHVTVPSGDELQRRKTARDGRIQGYTADLQQRFETEDAQAAIQKLQAEIDTKTAEIAKLDEALPQQRLVDDVPLNADPTLVLRPVEIGGVSGYHGVFENLSFVEISLAIDLHPLAEEDWVWLPLLPAALTSAGYVDQGTGVASDVAESQRATEIFELSAEYAMRPDRNRHELRITASGMGPDEAARAVTWLARSLHSPWLAEANVQRLRDLVDQATRGTRNTLGGREERWVNNPANALRYEHDRLYLSARSHHAALLSLARLEWRLMEPPSPEHAATVDGALAVLAKMESMDRAQALEILDGLAKTFADSTDGPGRTLRPVLQRLRELAGDMAPTTVAYDLRVLSGLVRDDLAVAPADALAQLDTVRSKILSRSGMRLALTGSTENVDALREPLGDLFRGCSNWPPPLTTEAPASSGTGRGLITARARVRDAYQIPAVHYGLVHGGGSSGVFVLSADAAGLDDLTEDALIEELACRVIGGAGPHGLFMQTWGAGLAYSNGIGTSAQSGRVRYYAERCPTLVETMRFVTGRAEAAASFDDATLVEYAVATAVGGSRASDRFEDRTRAMADELADGDTPERVERFRRAALALRDRTDLWPRLRERVVHAAGRVLPGVGPKSRDVPGGSYLTIAPEPLLAEWERYLQQEEGEIERVQRLYPRDFWVLDD